MKTFKDYLAGAAGLVSRPFVWDSKGPTQWTAYFFLNEKKFIVTITGLYSVSMISTVPLKLCITNTKDAVTIVATFVNIILNYLELH